MDKSAKSLSSTETDKRHTSLNVQTPNIPELALCSQHNVTTLSDLEHGHLAGTTRAFSVFYSCFMYYRRYVRTPGDVR